MKTKIFAGLILVLFAAGCVNFGGTTQASVDTTNIITLTPASISVIPKPPIDVEIPFTVTFEIKNQEKSKSIRADVDLFDWGVCKGQSTGDIEPTLTCPHIGNNLQSCHFDLVPQQTELVEIKAKAPSNLDIGGIAASCPFQWKASYKFSTVSSAGFNVVSRSHLEELQRAGKEVDVPATPANIGTGPVKPYITFSTDQNYVTSGSPIQMKVQVKDQGEGSFVEIPPATENKNMSIAVPADWVPDATKEDICTSIFGAPDIRDGKAFFTNREKIIFINRQTPEIVCNFKAPDLSASTPQKSYNVIVKLENYEYSITGKQTVEIKP